MKHQKSHHMKREIKFRAWDGYKMDYSPLVSTYDATVNSEFYFAESGQSGKIFQQFTGEKDIEGRDIYEGDIIRRSVGVCYPSKIHPSWENQTQKVDEIAVKWQDCGFPMLQEPRDPNFIQEIIVIGNIYEHPELINSQENT